MAAGGIPVDGQQRLGGHQGYRAMSQPHIRTCQHCGQAYDWRRSPSGSLKMTFCGSLCERAHLGFTIETLLGEIEFVKPAWRLLLAA
jgi:hypothetical protein